MRLYEIDGRGYAVIDGHVYAKVAEDTPDAPAELVERAEERLAPTRTRSADRAGSPSSVTRPGPQSSRSLRLAPKSPTWRRSTA